MGGGVCTLIFVSAPSPTEWTGLSDWTGIGQQSWALLGSSLINARWAISSFSLGKSRFLQNQTSGGPETCPLWSSRNKTEHSIFLGLIVAFRQSSRTPFSK